MPRGKRRNAGAAVPALTLEEGRRQLHELAGAFGRLTTPSESLLDRARSVGPFRKGGLVLVPEIDALAAVDRLAEAERENEELLEELEDVGILLLAQERLADPASAERLTPVEDLVRQFGYQDMLDE
jgi:hypothetical protein